LKRLTRASLAAAVLFASLTALMMLWWPLGFDQGIFSLNGATLLRGGLPYRDAWETRGPLAFYLFAAIEWAFGRSAFAVRLFDLLMLAAASAMLWRLTRRLAGATAATLVVVVWTLTLASSTYSHTAQPDLWVGYGVLAAVLLCTAPRGYSRAGLFASGLLIGLCTLLKPFYGGFLVAPVVAIWSNQMEQGRPWSRSIADLALVALGWVLPMALTLGALWVTGAWHDFIAVHLLYNVRVYASADHLSWGRRLSQFMEFAMKGKIVVVTLPAVVAGAVELWRTNRRLVLVVGSAILVALVSVLVQGKFYFYHWEPALVLCAPLAAVGISGAIRSAATGRLLGSATLAVIALHVSVRPAYYLTQWVQYVTGRRTSADYYQMKAFGEQTWTDPAEQRAAAAYLKGHTAPGTMVANWGWDAAVPFLADRPSASRFPVANVLTIAPSSPLTQQYRSEFYASMLANRPAYVIVGRHASVQGLAPKEQLGDLLPPLGAFLANGYVLDRSFGDLDLYRRSDFHPIGAR
jgi:4-amino-4-deoxy-L-arabinose transferase-like glycosyltransferase